MKSFQDSVRAWGAKPRWHGGLRTQPVKYIIAHATVSRDAVGTIHYLDTTSQKKASYNYLIDKQERIIRWLPYTKIAYHAGLSAWPFPPRPHESLNPVSVGVAWVSMDTEADPLTSWQHEAGIWLFKTLCQIFNLPASAIRGHREVSPGRKIDPTPALIRMADLRREVEALL